eukprot:gene13186-14534_t
MSTCVVQVSQTAVIERIKSDEVFQQMALFAKSKGARNPDFQFAWMFMNMVLTLLQFIRASREGHWLLHLASIEKLCTYFFSHDRLKYSQYTPEYIANMYDLRKTKPDAWEQLSTAGFCVKKNQVPFTSIGVDHALEQEKRRMKALGGVKGLTQNHDQLTQFCLIAPELVTLSAQIECVSGMVQSSRKKNHEISPKLLLRQEDNIRKLRDILSLSNPFT